MGYNNNHAGMHMIWRRRYAEYEDLEYYDRLAERNNEKRLIIRKSVEEIKKVPEPEAAEPEADIPVNTEEKNMAAEDENVVNEKEQQANKQSNKHKKKQKQYEPKLPQRPQHGAEHVIELKHLFKGNIICRNVMLIALKRKIGVKKIIQKTSDLMWADPRTNAKLSYDNDWSWLPIVEKTSIYLSLLAESLDCSIAELFLDDEESRRSFVYKLIADIPDTEWEEGEVDLQKGSAWINIDNYGLEYEGESSSFHDSLRSMDLTLYKDTFEDGKVNYVISYGYLGINIDSAYSFLTPGAYLLEESEGQLKDYIERLIANHPEWVIDD